MMLLELFTVLTDCALSLRLVMAAFFAGGIAAELLPRKGARVRWIVPAVCLCVMAVTEAVWQLHPSEYLILFCICGWFAETVLSGCALGAVIRLIRERTRRQSV